MPQNLACAARRVVALVVLATFAATAFGGVNSWTLQGPDGGIVNTLTLHPTNSQIAIAGSTRGIYRTTDGGTNWTLVNEQLLNTATEIAYDPTAASSGFNRVIAVSGQMLRSDDGGVTFALMQGPDNGNVQSIAFTTSGDLLAVSYGGALYKTTNLGQNWTQLPRGWPDDVSPTALTVDPNDNNRVFVGIMAHGIYRSTDGGMTWGPVGAGSPATTLNHVVYRIAVKPGDSNRVMAAASDGLARSMDGGTTWSIVASSSYSVAFDPYVAGRVTAVLAYGQVVNSTDDGSSFPVGLYSADLRVIGPMSLRFDATTAGKIWVATPDGVLVSTNSGTSFSARSHGISAGYVRKFSAADDGKVYVGFSQGPGGVFRHNASGWQAVGYDALRNAVQGPIDVYALATARQNSSVLYAARYDFQVVRSTDGGASWSTPHPAFTNSGSFIYDVEVDPANAQIAYVSSYTTGVWRTGNGGSTWFQKPTGLPVPLNTGVLAIDRAQPATVYVGSGPGAPPAVFKSTNGGDNWTPTGAFAGTSIEAIVIDPTNSNVVYVAANSGVFKSIDAGATWNAVDFGGTFGTSANASAVLFDPVYPSTMWVVAAPDTGAFLRSVDGGATWAETRIARPNGVNFLNQAVLDPLTPNKVFAGAHGAGIAEYEVGTDLQLSVTGLSTSLANATTVTATLSVHNQGPHAASPSQVKIVLPAWLTATVPNNCTVALQTLTCQFGALQVGQTRSLNLPLAVGAAGGTGQVTVTLEDHETELVPLDNAVTLPVTATEQADLELTGSLNPPTIDRDGTTTLTLTAINRGPSPSTNTTLLIGIPISTDGSNLTTTAGTCTLAPITANCSFGTLAVDGTVTVTLRLRGLAAGATTVGGTLDGAGTDSDSDQVAILPLVIRPVSDISVTLAESADPVTVDAPFQYLATVRNLGNDAGPVQLSVPVTGVLVSGATPSGGMTCTHTAVAVNCNIASLAALSSEQVTIDVASAVPGIATATATATFGGTDPVAGNNGALIGTTLRLVADVSVELASPPNSPLATPFVYVVTVRNAGPNAGAVHLDLPVTGATVSAATTNAGTCTTTAGAANCNFPALASGGFATVNVSASGAATGSALGAATVSFGGVDLVPDNNTASSSTLLRVTGDAGVTITDSADPATTGVGYSYSATVNNAGPNPGDVHLAVDLTGTSAASVTTTAGTCTTTATATTCDFPAFASGANATVTINVSAAAAGAASAAATVTFSGTDIAATNNAATASTQVNVPPPPPSKPSGGGGGGGRFDWLALSLLGLLIAQRWRGTRATARGDRAHQRRRRETEELRDAARG